MSVIDIVFIAIIAVFAVLGYRRGLMRTVLEVVAFFVAVILASYIATPFANMFYNSFVKSSVEKRIENKIEDIQITEKVTKENAAQAVFESMPDFAIKIAEGTGIGEEQILSKIRATKFDSVQMTDVVMTNVVEPIAVPAIKSISFIIISAVLIFLLRLLAKGMSKITEKDGFSADRLFGGVLGLAKAVVVIYVFCAALQLIYYSNADTSSGLGKMLSDSQVFNFMIDKNPIIDSLKNMF